MVSLAIRLDEARRLLRLAAPQTRGLRKVVLNTKTGRRAYWLKSLAEVKLQPKVKSQKLSASEFKSKAISFLGKDFEALSGFADEIVKKRSALYELRQKLEKRKKFIDEDINEIGEVLSLGDDFGMDDINKAMAKLDKESRDDQKILRFVGMRLQQSSKSGQIIKRMEEEIDESRKDIDQDESILRERLNKDDLKKRIGKVSGLSAEESSKLLAELNVGSLKGSGTNKKEVVQILDSMFQTVGKKLFDANGESYLETVLYKKDKHIPDYEAAIKTVNVGRVKEYGGTESILYHEIGHAIEEAQGYAESNVDWIRTRNEKLFTQSYSTKIYTWKGKDFATEITSTGMEMLASQDRLMIQFLFDRDHFLVTLGQII